MNVEYIWVKVTLDCLVHPHETVSALSPSQDSQENRLQGRLCWSVQWSWPSMGWMGNETPDQWKATLWRTMMWRKGTPLMIPGSINCGTRCVLVLFPVSGEYGRESCVRLKPHPSVQQAKSSGRFSSEELLNLKKEFQHHKDKIHEYNILIDAVSRTEGESMQNNSLGPSFGRVRLCLGVESGWTACPVRRWQPNKRHLLPPTAPPLSHGAVDFRMTHSWCVPEKDVPVDKANLL